MNSRIVQPAASFQPPETCTEHEECQTAQASHSELCDKALAHYEEVSAAAHHWNSLVPRAIEFYKQHSSRASVAAVEGDAADVLKVLAGRHHAEHHKQFPVESCPAWPCDILRDAAASSPAPAEPPPCEGEQQ